MCLVNRGGRVRFSCYKGIDVVLIIENMDEDFVRHFWDFIQTGEYTNMNRGEENKNFYRFNKPQKEGYPVMIELFSRKPTNYSLFDDAHLLPLHIADDISSLSAILLDDDHYFFLKDGVRIVSGIPVLNEEHLIPFKAKAWCELTDRSLSGEVGLTRHIKKHKNDIVTLSKLLAEDSKVKLEGNVARDMKRFIKEVKEMNPNDDLIESVCNDLSNLYLYDNTKKLMNT